MPTWCFLVMSSLTMALQYRICSVSLLFLLLELCWVCDRELHAFSHARLGWENFTTCQCGRTLHVSVGGTLHVSVENFTTCQCSGTLHVSVAEHYNMSVWENISTCQCGRTLQHVSLSSAGYRSALPDRACRHCSTLLLAAPACYSE